MAQLVAGMPVTSEGVELLPRPRLFLRPAA